MIPNSIVKQVQVYDIVGCKNELSNLFSREDEYVFNITGGTKPMSIATFGLAQEQGSPVVYLQSEGDEKL